MSQYIGHYPDDRQVKKIPLILLIAVLAAGISGCSAPAGPRVCFHTAGGKTVCLNVELAVSADERRLGLMYRSSLGARSGMLFVFESDADHAFTMRNTTVALSMIFIDRNKNVAGCIDHADPLTPGPYAIGEASRYVVETNASFCGREGLAPGDRVEFVNMPPL